MDYAKESLKMHYELKGKIEIKSRAAVDSKEALSLAYTPSKRDFGSCFLSPERSEQEL